MKLLKHFPLLLVIFPLAASQIILANVTQIPQKIYQNESAIMIFSLVNNYNETLTNVELNFTTSDKCLALLSDNISIDYWKPFQTIIFPIKLNNSCDYGYYWIKIDISSDQEQYNLTYPIVIYPKYSFSLRVDKERLVFNKENNINLILTYDGNYSLRDVNINLNASGCIIEGSTSYRLNKLDRQYTISLRVKPISSQCVISYSLRGLGFNNEPVSYSTLIYFDVLSVSGSLNVDVGEYTAKPGESVNLTLKLSPQVCTLKEVNIIPLVDRLPFSLLGRTSYYAYTLEPSNKYTVTFRLYIQKNAQSGDYRLPVEIIYKDCNNKLDKKVVYVPVHVNKRYTILAYSSINKNQIEITVANPNDEPINGVYVKLIPLANFTVRGPSYYFIGEIDANDYETAYFEIQPKVNTTSIKYEYIVYYTTPDNEKINTSFVETKFINNIVSKQASIPYIYLVISVAIVLLLFGWRLASKAKKSNK